jgi:hypothetical protein
MEINYNHDDNTVSHEFCKWYIMSYTKEGNCDKLDELYENFHEDFE